MKAKTKPTHRKRSYNQLYRLTCATCKHLFWSEKTEPECPFCIEKRLKTDAKHIKSPEL